jgi:hypothetical protein
VCSAFSFFELLFSFDDLTLLVINLISQEVTVITNKMHQITIKSFIVYRPDMFRCLSTSSSGRCLYTYIIRHSSLLDKCNSGWFWFECRHFDFSL